MTPPASELAIKRLGECRFESPLNLTDEPNDYRAGYTGDDQFVLHDIEVHSATTGALAERGYLEKAGPRQRLFFDPQSVHAAVLTAGGLCPGLNDVIRAIVMTLFKGYGVTKVTGLRYGYRGLYDMEANPPLLLDPERVREINGSGGTLLGSSRGGGERTTEMAARLAQLGINVLFTIGGDGTQKGALRLARELEARGLPISVVGVPKTIDNDLSFVERSFGFQTAVARAVDAVDAAYIEARDAPNGIGLVKLMGRESGFIAAHTALAHTHVSFALVPEVPFDLEGPSGLLRAIEVRLAGGAPVVIVVAEGAGQELVGRLEGKDASGNHRLGDIGLYLKAKIQEHFASVGREVSMKYIDPSYVIRGARAVPSDSIYCARLGANAAHAALAGKTECLVGLVNNRYVHVPMALAVHRRRTLDPEGPLWRDVVASTGQPPLMKNPAG